MKVILNTEDVSKQFRSLINKLVRTALKMSNSGLKKAQIEISFVDKDEIRQLNKEHRKIDKHTDVLSFPVLSLTPMTKVNVKDFPNDIDYETGCLMLGDIIICTDVAQENAKEYGHSYEREICYLIVHGCLHLLGFDNMEEDEKVLMRAVEESVLKKYKITRNEE